MKTLKTVLKFALVITCGFWAANLVSLWMDYTVHPEVYEPQSAPLVVWLLGASLYFAIAVGVECILLYIVCRILQKKEKDDAKK